MENKIAEIRKGLLLHSLTVEQQKHLESIDWLFNGPRGSGRTYLVCVTALLNLINGGYESHVIDHHTTHDGIRSYTKAMIHDLADKIQMAIVIKETRSGFVVRLAPEYEQYEIDYKRKNESKS